MNLLTAQGVETRRVKSFGFIPLASSEKEWEEKVPDNEPLTTSTYAVGFLVSTNSDYD